MSELLPCPFCGGAPRHLELKPGFYTERVICDSCEFFLSPEKWNRRAALASPWVSVDDRMPERWQHAIVAVQGFEQGLKTNVCTQTLLWDGDKWRIGFGDTPYPGEVIYWQPLPPAPAVVARSAEK